MKELRLKMRPDRVGKMLLLLLLDPVVLDLIYVQDLIGNKIKKDCMQSQNPNHFLNLPL